MLCCLVAEDVAVACSPAALTTLLVPLPSNLWMLVNAKSLLVPGFWFLLCWCWLWVSRRHKWTIRNTCSICWIGAFSSAVSSGVLFVLCLSPGCRWKVVSCGPNFWSVRTSIIVNQRSIPTKPPRWALQYDWWSESVKKDPLTQAGCGLLGVMLSNPGLDISFRCQAGLHFVGIGNYLITFPATSKYCGSASGVAWFFFALVSHQRSCPCREKIRVRFVFVKLHVHLVFVKLYV